MRAIKNNLCLRCGACVGVCLSAALELEETGIIFDKDKCNLCKICEKACPVRAIKIE